MNYATEELSDVCEKLFGCTSYVIRRCENGKYLKMTRQMAADKSTPFPKTAWIDERTPEGYEYFALLSVRSAKMAKRGHIRFMVYLKHGGGYYFYIPDLVDKTGKSMTMIFQLNRHAIDRYNERAKLGLSGDDLDKFVLANTYSGDVKLDQYTAEVTMPTKHGVFLGTYDGVIRLKTFVNQSKLFPNQSVERQHAYKCQKSILEQITKY